MIQRIYKPEPERLSAALCDAHGQMSMASLETRLIVAATRHADALGIGYRELMADRNVWVLSRMSIEMERMPAILDTFVIETWVESFSRHISYRNFAVLDGEGRPMGYARSLWTCISLDTRRPSTLAPLDCAAEGRECPIASIPRLTAVGEPVETSEVTFSYSDIDFNRHVNSARYVERLADALGMEWHDRHRIVRLDIAYLHETHYGDKAHIDIARSEDDTRLDADITVGDTAVCRARLTVAPR